jgi:hypothetical protein
MAAEITVRQRARTRTLGVDPRLVLVIDFHATIDPDEIRRNGMRVLDGSDRHAIVAFADDPGLAIFHERLAAYRGEIPEGQKAAPYESFFDSIVNIRTFGPDDRVAPDLAADAQALPEPVQLRLDVTCWHPDDAALASVWLQDLRTAAREAGGSVITAYQNDTIGVLIARVSLPSNRLAELAELDVIASINRLPITELTLAEFHNLPADELPLVLAPARNAPVLGLIDSGVASAHPLIAGAVQAAEALSPFIADGEDRHGHGTMVASIALHGHIPDAIRQTRLVPIARVVSVAVLDGGGSFPDDSLWEQDLADAITYCAEQGARVINISLGDPSRPFRGPRQPAIAAIVDHLARLHNLVVVAATGNADPGVYVDLTAPDPTRSYVADLLNDADTGIIPPGTAALAITVGGICLAGAAGGYVSREPVERRPLGAPGWPSSVTRQGPGVERSIKPELVAPSGTHGHEPRRIVRDSELEIIAASVGLPGRLLRADLGTSFAAPLVSRIALGVLARYPEFSANLVRALVLLGARPTWAGEDLEVGNGALSQSRRRAVVQQLGGYGQSTLERTLDISSHRAVLVAEADIAMDGVHIYELPIPESFYASGGSRFLDVALAFDPPTRSQRLDYLGNKLEFYVVRDIDVTELVEVFTRLAEEEPDDDVEEDEESPDLNAEEAEREESKASSGIGAMLGSRLIRFDSTVSERSRSTNQLARVRFSRRWERSDAGSTFVVIRSVNRWSDNALQQPYGLAVSLRRDDDQPEIYAELAARLDAIIEVELELDAQAEVEIELTS